jgi:hypothetical protein
MEECPICFSSVVHFNVHFFESGEWSIEVSIVILVAIDVLSFPCNGRLLEGEKDGVDEIKGFFLRVGEESSAEDADGVYVIACNGNFARGDVVCVAYVEDMDDDCVDSCKFASIGVAIF